MHYRHEWKHEITPFDRLILRSRFNAVMQPDRHTIDGVYHIRSLYFDNAADTALREKLDGAAIREKFRIRFYNNDLSYIVLEKKCKVDSLCRKESCRLTPEEAGRLSRCETDWMLESGRPLLQELYARMQYQGLRPKTIVDYTRDPYIYGPGNVRVTMDYDIRTGLTCTDLLNPEAVTIPAGDNPIILEVKWDEYLPDIIRDAVQLPGRRVTAFSKYAQCRVYG